MALKPCSECGEQISQKAKACPKCGAPVSQAGKLDTSCSGNAAGCLSLIVLLALVWVLIAVFATP